MSPLEVVEVTAGGEVEFELKKVLLVPGLCALRWMAMFHYDGWCLRQP